MLRRTLSIFCTVVSCGLPVLAHPPAGAERTDVRQTVVRLVHDGRFDEADARLADQDLFPAEAEREFLRAFVLYWRLLYDEDDRALKAAFDGRLEEALASAEAVLRDAPRDPEALLWNGTSHLFRAELRASEKRPFAAAMEARRARRALASAQEADPTRADAWFGLGTVDVLADELPALARGVGSFLGLSGDRDRGIAELERAGREGRIFALEARLFLLGIRSSRKKRVYSGALEEADLVAASLPTSVVALDGSARVRIALGAAGKAAEDLDAALAIVARAPGTDPGVIARLLVQRAQAELARFRPDLALGWLRRLVPLRGSIPAAVREDAAGVARIAAQSTSVPPWFPELAAAIGTLMPPASDAAPGSLPGPWTKAIPALDLERAGEPERAAESLEQLASESPDDPLLSLLAGRAALLAGRPASARSWLSRAAAAPGLPEAWLGPCLLLAGRAADLAGDRAAAIASYRRAAHAPSFIDREAAWLHLSDPYRGPS